MKKLKIWDELTISFYDYVKLFFEARIEKKHDSCMFYFRTFFDFWIYGRPQESNLEVDHAIFYIFSFIFYGLR